MIPMRFLKVKVEIQYSRMANRGRAGLRIRPMSDLLLFVYEIKTRIK
jgi:hypothetical protein